ncbi:MAG TPA: DUF1638 domain-containing protein [Methanomassiliicoccales archaeon]|jgi:hypothetical protein
MRIGIIACDIWRREIDAVVGNDPDIVHKEYLEFALHVDSAKLKATVIERVNSLEGKVDAVFLGYAICQSLKGVKEELRVPTVMLDADDCIGALLSPLRYAEEKRKVTGTWFNTSGWAEMGLKGVIKELRLDSAIEQGYEPMYFVKILFAGYSRCLYIDTGVGEKERFQGLSEQFSNQVGLQHECTSCGLDALAKAWKDTKALALQQ